MLNKKIKLQRKYCIWLNKWCIISDDIFTITNNDKLFAITNNYVESLSTRDEICYPHIFIRKHHFETIDPLIYVTKRYGDFTKDDVFKLEELLNNK